GENVWFICPRRGQIFRWKSQSMFARVRIQRSALAQLRAGHVFYDRRRFSTSWHSACVCDRQQRIPSGKKKEGERNHEDFFTSVGAARSPMVGALRMEFGALIRTRTGADGLHDH